jgi:hypothetical protein
MPNWKKVIVSGSNASLNTLNVISGLNVTGSSTFSGSLTVSGSTNIVGNTGTTLLSTNADTLVFTGSLYISGSTVQTGSLSITNITSSLFGTASYASNADLLDGLNSTVFATTGSNTFTGAQIISSSLTVFTGSVIEFQVTNTGTKIGSALSDTHTITGSVNITGSLNVYNGEIFAGRIDNGSEGGQVSFGRASDNLTGWYIDVYGDTSTPSLRFVDVSTSAVRMTISGSGGVTMDQSLAVGSINPSATVGRIDASNDVVAFSTSDIRFKENITPISNALHKLNKIGGYEFDWKNEEELVALHGFTGHDVGVIAQEIEEILPEVVTTRDSGYKAVKYEKIVPLLIQCIKELKQEIDSLKNK